MPPIGTTRVIQRVLLAADFLLLVITIGVLTYLSENHYWTQFFWVFGICFLLEVFIKLAQSKPVVRYLEKLEKQEFRLVNTFNELGMENMYRMDIQTGENGINKRNEVIVEAIENAQELYLLAETGQSYLDPTIRRHWNYIEARLNAHVRFKVLIIDPFCPAKQLRNRLNNINSLVDPKLSIERLIELGNRYQNLEIRFTPEAYCSLFITNSYTIYDPYHLGKVNNRLENYFFAIDFEANSYGYRLLKNHFDACWNSSTSLQDFIAQHGQQLGL